MTWTTIRPEAQDIGRAILTKLARTARTNGNPLFDNFPTIEMMKAYPEVRQILTRIPKQQRAAYSQPINFFGSFRIG